METVSNALERYKELKESLFMYNKDFKEMISFLRSDISMLLREQAETKVEIRNLLKEIEYKGKEHERINSDIQGFKSIISSCPICSNKINLNELEISLESTKTRSNISISINLLLIAALISHLALRIP